MEKSIELDPRLLHSMHLGNDVTKVLPAMDIFLNGIAAQVIVRVKQAVKAKELTAEVALEICHELVAIEKLRGELKKLVKQGNSASTALEPRMQRSAE